jgi:hypothetical protein
MLNRYFLANNEFENPLRANTKPSQADVDFEKYIDFLESQHEISVVLKTKDYSYPGGHYLVGQNTICVCITRKKPHSRLNHVVLMHEFGHALIEKMNVVIDRKGDCWHSKNESEAMAWIIGANETPRYLLPHFHLVVWMLPRCLSSYNYEQDDITNTMNTILEIYKTKNKVEEV